jgi:hypothetical protein
VEGVGICAIEDGVVEVLSVRKHSFGRTCDPGRNSVADWIVGFDKDLTFREGGVVLVLAVQPAGVEPVIVDGEHGVDRRVVAQPPEGCQETRDEYWLGGRERHAGDRFAHGRIDKERRGEDGRRQ